MLGRCLQRLWRVFIDIISFILLIPTDSSRAAVSKKVEDDYDYNYSTTPQPLLSASALPRPLYMGHKAQSIARLRNYNAESELVKKEAYNEVSPGPTKEVRVRRSITREQVQGQNQVQNNTGSSSAVLGLRGSRPIVAVSRYRMLSEEGSHDPPSHTSSERTLDLDTSPPAGSYNPSTSTMQTICQANAPSRAISPSEDLPTLSPEDLVYQTQIGGGGFGQVWRGSWRGTPVAIKCLSMGASSTSAAAGDYQAALKAFEDEALVLAKLRHPNICLLLGVLRGNGGMVALVTELLSRGSLWDALRTPYHLNVG
jgi:hypothetical protein